jgi:hypothetical protein
MDEFNYDTKSVNLFKLEDEFSSSHDWKLKILSTLVGQKKFPSSLEIENLFNFHWLCETTSCPSTLGFMR